VSNLIFLALAVGISIVGSLIIWYRNRKPTTFMSSIDSFQKEMTALARDPNEPQPKRARGSTPTRPEPIMPTSSQADLASKLRSARQRQSDPEGG